ncbi:tetratricopeptide repeat protein [Sphingobacterium ginsenosidimutans]
MKKHLLLIILLLFSFGTIAQNRQQQMVDSLLVKIREFHQQAEFVPQLETSLKVLEIANSSKYDTGIAKAHFFAADALVNIGLFKEGFKHLKSIESTEYYNENVLMQTEIHWVRGRTYLKLGLPQQAIREFYLQLACTKHLENKMHQKRTNLNTYANLITAFDQLEQLDSMQKYCQFQLEYLSDFDKKEEKYMYLGLYNALGDLYTRKRDFGKAEYYLNQSLELIEKFNISIFYNTYTFLGNLEEKKLKPEKALYYYEKGLANAKDVGNREEIRNDYKFLADYCRTYKLGENKAKEYELAFVLLNDSLEDENRKIIDVVLNQVLNEKDKESEAKVSKSVRISIFTLLLLLVAISFFVWRSKHNRKVLLQKEDALQETETVNRELTEQIGENKFNNLIELAKSNNPEFLTLFTELYPQFIEALKSRDSNLRSTELEFCAMAFLNFSTKNIAEYTFVTIRAVQVRKNRLRKKFDIPSDADFNNWMRNQISPYQLAKGDDKLRHDDREIIKY